MSMIMTGRPLTESIFSRNLLVYGQIGFEKLQHSRLIVFGLGGVGGYAAESLVRSGIGHLILVDFDTFHISNLNRQIGASLSTLGRPKVEVIAERLMDINPELRLTLHSQFMRDPEHFQAVIPKDIDFIIDAIDSLQPKVRLLTYAFNHHLPIIACAGSGGRRYPGLIRTADLSETHGCPFLSKIRKFLRRQGIHQGIPCIFSTEFPVPSVPPTREEIENHDESSGRIRNTIGSLPFVPAIIGLSAAAYCVNQLIPPSCEKY